LEDVTDVTIEELQSAKRHAIKASAITIHQIRQVTHDLGVLQEKIIDFNNLILDKASGAENQGGSETMDMLD
jgi:hypothetical protein